MIPAPGARARSTRLPDGGDFPRMRYLVDPSVPRNEGIALSTSISDYRHLPSQHCASGALRNLLFHYCALDLSEEAVFGLGSGIDCIYLSGLKSEPAVVVFGRTATLEQDVGQALGVDYREVIEPDDRAAWEIVRREVAAGRPTMLAGDIFYLDYRKFKVHFPGHRFVLVGYDDEKEIAYLMDRTTLDPQPCSYAALARSRNSPDGFSTFNLWGKFHGTRVGRSIEEACAVALRRNVDRMLGRDTAQADLLRMTLGDGKIDVTTGLAGLARLSAELPDWRAREDRRFLASYVAQTIEDFGTGGGHFRRMYAVFLRWARGRTPELVPEDAPSIALEAAGRWTLLSATLDRASRTPEDETLWKQAAAQAADIHETETRLFEGLAARMA